MENEPIKTKILADYKTLLALPLDSPDLIQDKLKLLSEHMHQLSNAEPTDTQTYEQAATLIESALSTEYVAFRGAASRDDKEQVLVQLKHKVAEACQRVGLHE